MTRSQISTTSVKYIDGIHAARNIPQQRRVQVSLPLEINNVASSQVEVRNGTKRVTSQNSSDFYAQVASQAWSPSTNTRLKRKRSRLTEFSSEKVTTAKLQIVNISNRIAAGLKLGFRYFQQVIHSTLNKIKSVLKKVASNIATRNNTHGSNRMLLTVCLFQIMIILALCISLYSTNRAYNESQAQAAQYQQQMREDFDTQLNSLQSEWQGVLKGWQNSQSLPANN